MGRDENRTFVYYFSDHRSNVECVCPSDFVELCVNRDQYKNVPKWQKGAIMFGRFSDTQRAMSPNLFMYRSRLPNLSTKDGSQ